MNAKLKFCDYLNSANFMRIEDKGNHFEVRMKSIIKNLDEDGSQKGFFKIDDTPTSKYFYLLEFSKAIL